METLVDKHILIDDDGSQWITIKDAASMTGISSSTIRRKAKAGEIYSRTETMQYGDTIYLLLEDVKRVNSALSVLSVKRNNNNQEMAFAIARIIDEHMQEQDRIIMDKLSEVGQDATGMIGNLHAETEALRREISVLQKDIALVVEHFTAIKSKGTARKIIIPRAERRGLLDKVASIMCRCTARPRQCVEGLQTSETRVTRRYADKPR